MEMFSVTCTTCQSRLKVRERSAIGQILACPKCQGMVLIQPPAGWIDPGTERVSAPAPAAAQPVAAAKVPVSNFDDAAALLVHKSAEPAAPPMMETWPEGPAEIPHGDLVSPTQRLRRWLLMGGLGTAAATVLIVALVYAIGGGKGEDVVVAESPESNKQEDVIEPPIENEPDQTKKESPSVENPPTTDSKEPDPKAIEEKPVEVSKSPDVPMKASPDAPPDIAVKPESQEPTEPKPLNNFNVDNTLKEFGPLIESETFDKVESAAPPGERPATTPMPSVATTPNPASEEEPFAQPDPRKIDVARRLNDPLAAVEMSDIALADFLQFVTDLTAVPVSLETAALPAIKVSPETKITVSLKKTTVGDLLSAALAPHHLAFVAREDGIVVLPVASSQSALKEIKHDVSDLAPDAAAVETLAGHIQAVIDPASWKVKEGFGDLVIDGNTLIITQTPETQFAIVLLCEKLRLARKLPTRSSYPASIVTLAPRFGAAQPVLDQPLTINFVPPTRLSKVQERVKTMTGLRVLVNWQAILEQGWTPETEVKIGAANQPLGQFIDRLSRRMGLVYRVIDANTVQVTSSLDLEARPDIEVYPLDNADEERIKKLQATLGSGAIADAGSVVLRYDAASRALIARLPQPLQKKLAEALLKL